MYSEVRQLFLNKTEEKMLIRNKETKILKIKLFSPNFSLTKMEMQTENVCDIFHI